MIYVLVVGLYVLALLALSAWKSREIRSADDFVVAGRSVSAPVLVATLVCTWIGSGSLFGTAGLTFRTGVSELWFSAGAWAGILVVYLLAHRVRRLGAYTLTDVLGQRFGSVAKLLGTITIIVAYLIIAGYQFRGGGRFISILAGGAVSPETGMLIAAALIVGFTALAGMVSIVAIDVFNGALMLLAMMLALPLAVAGHGGFAEVIATIAQADPGHLTVFGDNDAFWVIGIVLPTFLLLLTESGMYQKFASARDEQAARRAVIGMFVGIVIIETLMMAIALTGFAIYADDSRFFLADGTVDRAAAEEIILRIGYEQLPAWCGALLLAAGAAIILSTGNTFLMVTSTNVVRDILQVYAPAVVANADAGVRRGLTAGATRPTGVTLQRIVIVVFGALAFVLMSGFETILEMALVSYTMIGASLAPALLAAFFWPHATRAGGVASIAAGMMTVAAIAVANRLLTAGGRSAEILGGLLPLDTDYIAIPAVVVSVTTLVAVSLLARQADGDAA